MDEIEFSQLKKRNSLESSFKINISEEISNYESIKQL